METRSILFVDDDAQYLGLLLTVLAGDGFDTCKATSAEEAIAILSTRRFTMMVTDLQMPGMDGLELARVAKRLDPLMEIALVTGAVSPEVLGMALFVGIDAVLAKPVRMQDLQDIVRGAAADHDPRERAFGTCQARRQPRLAL